MPTTFAPFRALTRGNGFPFCVKDNDTIGNTNGTSHEDAFITFRQAFDLWWLAKEIGLNIPSFYWYWDEEAMVVSLEATESLGEEPKKRVCPTPRRTFSGIQNVDDMSGGGDIIFMEASLGQSAGYHHPDSYTPVLPGGGYHIGYRNPSLEKYSVTSSGSSGSNSLLGEILLQYVETAMDDIEYHATHTLQIVNPTITNTDLDPPKPPEGDYSNWTRRFHTLVPDHIGVYSDGGLQFSLWGLYTTELDISGGGPESDFNHPPDREFWDGIEADLRAHRFAARINLHF